LNHVAETQAHGSEDLDRAIALLTLNLDFNPDAAYSHLMLGQLHAMNGDVEAAIASVERSLELDPDNPRAMKLLDLIRAPE
jgi:cytochrome c-type biogenesis protein CcmH/NrfG